MNINCRLDHKMQYDFLKSTVKKKKRFSKWLKADEDKKVDIICQSYGYNRSIAKSCIDLFDSKTLDDLEKRLNKGGNSKR